MDALGEYIRQTKLDLEKYHVFSFIGLVVVMVEVLMVVCVCFTEVPRKLCEGRKKRS